MAVVKCRVGIDFGTPDAAVVVVEPVLTETDELTLDVVYNVRAAMLVSMADLRAGLDRIAAIIAKAKERTLGSVEVYCDASSLGRYAAELLRQKLREVTKTRLFEVQILGAGAVNANSDPQKVPRIELLRNVVALLECEKIKIPTTLKELSHQLRALQIQINENRKLQIEPAEGARDDLAMALALAVWRPVHPFELEFPPRGPILRDPI